MHAENGDEDKLLAAQLAHGVAEKLCNVDTLAIQTMLEDPILIKFIETLGRFLMAVCITVTPEIVKPFVASPLKTVIFEGPLGSALQLRALKLGQLDALKVSTWFGFSVPDDEFYSDSNMLFQTTESAPVVKFCIDIEDKVISAADIYWPCLTHLDVCDKYIDDLALDLVPRVPNLVRRQTTGGGNSESGNNGKSAEEGDHDDAAVGTGFDSGFRDGYQAGFEEGRRRIETTPGAPKA
ncbi:hypothetical protein GGF43_002881 [Coemansia sp. RSA 2618]|nr:hypothetical protein GGF43_002881 [Coemansia sp. RSA 2618]